MEMLKGLLYAVLIVETEAADVDGISAQTVLSKHIADKRKVQKKTLRAISTKGNETGEANI